MVKREVRGIEKDDLADFRGLAKTFRLGEADPDLFGGRADDAAEVAQALRRFEALRLQNQLGLEILDAIEWRAVAVDGWTRSPRIAQPSRSLRPPLALWAFLTRALPRLTLLGRKTGFAPKWTDFYHYEARQKARCEIPVKSPMTAERRLEGDGAQACRTQRVVAPKWRKYCSSSLRHVIAKATRGGQWSSRRRAV